jgi:hypothetical protein
MRDIGLGPVVRTDRSGIGNILGKPETADLAVHDRELRMRDGMVNGFKRRMNM